MCRTCLAIAGDGFVVGVADTRVARDYSILTRHGTKMGKLTPTCYILSAGQQAERRMLHKTLLSQISQYYSLHGRHPSTESVAQLLSVVLYNRRFFPWYTFNLIIGIDAEGKGAIYGYDAIGSHERLSVASQGSGKSMVQSLLDNQVAAAGKSGDKSAWNCDVATRLAVDALASACERDIMTGDGAEVIVIKADGTVETRVVEMRKD